MKNLSEFLSLFEYKLLWPAFYSICKGLYKQDEKRILFTDPYSTELTDNMKPIHAKLRKKGGYKLICCFPSSNVSAFEKKNPIFKKVGGRLRRETTYLRFLKEYARCGTLFLSESYLPAYAVKRRHGTQVVQLWHGSGAFKKWGYSTLSKGFGADEKSAKAFPMHNCYTLVPISAAEVAPHYAEAFGLSNADSIIRPLGVPRTDVLFDKAFVKSAKRRLYDSLCRGNADFKKAFPSYDDFSAKQVVLYAPTFRGKTITAATSSLNLNFETLRSELSDSAVCKNGFVFLTKLHPFVSGGADIPNSCKQWCFDVSSFTDTNTLLCASDLLITDYSSIIFEYSLLTRPMIFYAYDLETYIGERDFYYNYEDFVPGKITKTQSELTAEIKRLLKEHASNNETSACFAKKYMSACDGYSTKRIIETLK